MIAEIRFQFGRVLLWIAYWINRLCGMTRRQAAQDINDQLRAAIAKDRAR